MRVPSSLPTVMVTIQLRDEDVNDFFAKWINKLLVDELIAAHLEDDIGTVDESAPDNLQSVEKRGAKCVPERVALRWK